MPSVLSKPSKYLRSTPTRRAATEYRVDRTGGFDKAGVIRGVSVITRGEALGHDLWVDAEMLDQVADAINASSKGAKARFTHPGLSGDGLGRYVGRVMDARVVGDQVLADQHFSNAGHKTPDGDLAGYLMDLADSDPEAYGLSIVFGNDEEASDTFEAEHESGNGFESPDSRNTRNLRHARVAELRAVDAVDEPAANPDGLFHRNDDIASQAEPVVAYALSLTDERPAGEAFGIDADRLRGFMSRFLSSRRLHLTTEVSEMETQEIEATETVEDVSGDTPAVEEADNEATQAVAEDTPEAGAEAEAPEAELVAASGREEAKRFREAFGVAGLEWFCEGMTFEEASKAYTAKLESENESLKKRLETLSAGESEPVDFEPESRADANKQPKGLAGAIRIAGVN
jgi:hypothetical protein